MSLMARLKGVSCVKCRRRGHHCQAQMMDGDTPVCLRCADDELCVFERVKYQRVVRVFGEADLCAVEAISAEDFAYCRALLQSENPFQVRRPHLSFVELVARDRKREAKKLDEDRCRYKQVVRSMRSQEEINLIYADFQHMPVKEIAVKHGISLSYVYSLRAKTRLVKTRSKKM